MIGLECSLIVTTLGSFLLKNRMSKMVRKHLSRKYVLQDELYLEKIVDSQEKCELCGVIRVVTVFASCL